MPTPPAPPTAATVPRLPAGADQALLEIARHRLLDTEQVHRLCFPTNNPSWTRNVLGSLRRAGYIESVARKLTVPEQGGTRRSNLSSVWWATEQGLAAARDMPGQNGRRFHRVKNPLANTQTHTLRVNEVGVQVTTALHGVYPVTWAHEIKHTLRRAGRPTHDLAADAMICVDTTQTATRTPATFLLELDRANSSLMGQTRTPGLADKIGLYLAYARARGDDGAPVWRDHYRVDDTKPASGFPAVWVVIDGPTPWLSSERRDALLTALRDPAHFGDLATTDDLWVMTSTFHDLTTMGPLGYHAHQPNGDVTNLLGHQRP